MRSLDYRRVHRTKLGGVYLTYHQIEEFTEEILEDYNPQLLREPAAVEYDDFLESYLGVNLDYQNIYTSSNEGDILGCAIFSKHELAKTAYKIVSGGYRKARSQGYVQGEVYLMHNGKMYLIGGR